MSGAGDSGPLDLGSFNRAISSADTMPEAVVALGAVRGTPWEELLVVLEDPAPLPLPDCATAVRPVGTVKESTIGIDLEFSVICEAPSQMPYFAVGDPSGPIGNWGFAVEMDELPDELGVPNNPIGSGMSLRSIDKVLSNVFNSDGARAPATNRTPLWTALLLPSK